MSEDNDTQEQMAGLADLLAAAPDPQPESTEDADEGERFLEPLGVAEIEPVRLEMSSEGPTGDEAPNHACHDERDEANGDATPTAEED